jgi:MFS family permease
MGNLGSLFGYYILPPISDKFGVRKPFIWPSIIINVAFWILAFFSRNLIVAAICLFIGAFFNGWSVTGARSMLQESPGIAGLRSGTALGMMNTFSKASSAIFPMVFAGFVAMTGSAVVALSLVSLFAVLASVLVMLSKETGIGREAAKLKQQEKKAAKLNAIK